MIRACVEEALAGMTAAPRLERTRVLNIDEVAELLGVSSATINRLIRDARQKKGSFPFHKQSGKLMFLESELLEWVTSKR